MAGGEGRAASERAARVRGAALPPERLRRFREDPYARRLGFRLLAAGPGYARVAVELTPDLFNFAGFPHGGLLFSLADYAFAVASNAHGQVAVATSVSIQFLAAARAGDRLVAEARELHLTRRAGFYEMTVRTAGGQLLARALGVVHRMERELDALPAGPPAAPPAPRTLHEAIARVLAEAGRPLPVGEVHRRIVRQDLYRQRDGSPVTLQQVHARIRRYPALFELDRSTRPARVRLRTAEGAPGEAPPAGAGPPAP